MVKFNIITGFLGSGKTTLLKHLLMQHPHKRRAVIQNEFAPSGVDGKELKQVAPGLKLMEINNGSVFCVCQFSNFTTTLQKLIEEVNPEEIYLETSGLADPINVAELLQDKLLSNLVRLNLLVTVTDAANYFKGLNLLQRFKHQLMVADLILINKTDLGFENVEKIKDHIRGLNPYAVVEATSYAEIDSEIFKNTSSVSKKKFELKPGGKPDELTACVLRTHDCLKANQLSFFLRELQKSCPRIKGFMHLPEGSAVSIHSVFEELTITPLKSYTGMNELIAFGYKLTTSELRQKYNEYKNRQENELPIL